MTLEIPGEIPSAILPRIFLEMFAVILLGIISIAISSGIPGGVIHDNLSGVLPEEVRSVILPEAHIGRPTRILAEISQETPTAVVPAISPRTPPEVLTMIPSEICL